MPDAPKALPLQEVGWRHLLLPALAFLGILGLVMAAGLWWSSRIKPPERHFTAPADWSEAKLAGTAALPIPAGWPGAGTGAAPPAEELPPPPPAPGGPPPNGPPDAITAALDAVRNGACRGAEALARMPPQPQRQAEVVAVLTEAMNHDTESPAAAAVKALTVWGGRASVPAMAGRLRQMPVGECALRIALLDALGELQDARAAEAVASWFPADRIRVARALKGMGPGAEAAVLPWLNFHEPRVRVTACEILGVIGTRIAYPRLNELQGQDPNFGVKRAAARAQEAIQEKDPQIKPPPVRIIK
jgi:hypothetical protein